MLAAVPSVIVVSSGTGHSRSLLGTWRSWACQQIASSSAYRTLYFYNLMLGLTACATAIMAAYLGHQWARTTFDGWILRPIEHYLSELLVANVIIVGALILRRNREVDARRIDEELAARLLPFGPSSARLQWQHAALLILRVAVIGPVFVWCGLALLDREVGTLITRLLGVAGALAATGVASVAFGAILAALRARAESRASWLWFGLFIVPELAHAVVTGFPTPRTLIQSVFDGMSLGGVHL